MYSKTIDKAILSISTPGVYVLYDYTGSEQPAALYTLVNKEKDIFGSKFPYDMN